MSWSYHKINFQKIAGVLSILGIDITERRVKVVELYSRGGLFNKFRSEFIVKKYFTVEFEENSSQGMKKKKLLSEIHSRSITTKYISSTIQSLGVRSVIAQVPASANNITEWIKDNFEKLLRIPIPYNEIRFEFEILSENSVSKNIEITFARKNDVEMISTFFSSLGFTLVSLSGGVRDAQNILLYSDAFMKGEISSFAYCHDETVTISEFREQKKVRTYSLDKESAMALLEKDSTVVGVGTFAAKIKNIIDPFGIPSEYSLAVGCALRGAIPELHNINLMEQSSVATFSERIQKNIFHRTVVLCGSILFLLLMLQTIATMYIENRHDEVERKFLDSGLNYTEIALLERQNSELKTELQKAGSFDHRSNNAKILHELAAITPEGLWFYKIETNASSRKILLSGYSSNGDNIAEFIRSVEKNSLFQDVRLLRSGMPMQNENMSTVERRIKSPMTFELQATVKK